MQRKVRIIGDHPLARDEQGKLKSHIGTVFPEHRTLVTISGVHGIQRQTFLEVLDRERRQQGQPPLGAEEWHSVWNSAVDLVIDERAVLIRPDPENMPLAFAADELLQELVSKQHIRYLYLRDQRVREAIKRRGECWRINPLPRWPAEMKQLIVDSRMGIGEQEIYYYNRLTGVRLLTCQQLASLAALDENCLRRQLAEIQQFAGKLNPQGYPEIEFFLAGTGFSHADFTPYDFSQMDEAQLRAVHRQLCEKFEQAVPAELRQDDPDDPLWRNRMYAALVGSEDDPVSEEELLGLSHEFFMQIEWLPGGRIEEGELIFDSLFDEAAQHPDDAELARLCDEKSKKLIYNFVREYGDLEYVNIGRVIGSLSHRQASLGRRDVYIAEMKQRGRAEEIINIIRMQKWGVRERLDEGKSLLQAIIESEEYTEYTLDRRLGCRQLGMNLPPRVTAHRISERYMGSRKDLHGILVWSPYFQRDYIRGIATDKIPRHRYQNPEFCRRLAILLGRAAAPNMIVGRCDLWGKVLFDDGDEVIVEDAQGMPADIIVADLTGTFADYRRELTCFAAAYAEPVNSRVRAGYLPDPAEFARLYLESFRERFVAIQREYRQRQRAFDTLFKHCRRDEAGSFAYRWECVLDRLNRTDADDLVSQIAANLELGVQVGAD